MGQRVDSSVLPAGWQRLTPACVDQLCALVQRVELVDNPPYRTSAEEVVQWFADPATQQLVGLCDEDGNLIAFAHARRRALRPDTITCQGCIDPAWRSRGLGVTISRWLVQAGSQMLGQAGLDSGRVVIMVESDNVDFARHMDEQGFTWTGSLLEVVRDARAPLASPDLPAGVSVGGWNAELDDEVRRCLNRMNAEVGGQPLDAAQWAGSRRGFCPAASFIARDHTSDRTRVVGFLLSSLNAQDWAALGASQGYIELVGIEGEWLDSGAVQRMVAAAAAAFADMGLDVVTAGFSSANTQLLDMFTRMGFSVRSRVREYSREVRAAAGI